MTVTADAPHYFCRVCTRVRPVSEFYDGNRSTCRSCKVDRVRLARAADPGRSATVRRLERARGRLRAEFATFVLRRLLPGADDIWKGLADELAANLDRDSFLDVEPLLAEARYDWRQLFLHAVHGAEDELGLDPGSGLDVLSRILKGNNGIPSNR